MIYVEDVGRCGNQMFIYAHARYVQVKTGDNDLIISCNKILEQNRPEEGWYDCLTDFQTVSYQYYNKSGKVLENETNLLQKILCGIKMFQMFLYKNKNREKRASVAPRFQKILNYFGIYWLLEGVTEIFPHKRKKMIVTGSCQSYMIEEITDLLKKELKPKYPIMEMNKALAKKIMNEESVCLSIRRGNYFTPKYEQSFAVCTIEYYQKAVQRMQQMKPDAHFFVFSDDIAWCKENIQIEGLKLIYVSQEMPIYETLRLMYLCKNFILSNSTFSWWGQFLSESQDKIVISPSRWNNDGHHSRIIGKDWILIDV